MPRLGPVDWRTLIKIFEMLVANTSARKAHTIILRYPGARRAVVIPEYDVIDVEIIKNNMRTVNMTRQQYFALLNRL